MKKITLFLFVFIISCSKARTIPAPDYDLLVRDMLKMGRVEGTAILFDVKTMRILYMYNPEMAISRSYEPGSIIKPATTIAYFYNHKPFTYNSNGIYMVYPGDNSRPRRKVSSRTWRIRRGDYFPDGGMCPRGRVEYEDALAASSNSYFLHMMSKLRFSSWLAFLKSAGFGKKTGITFPLVDNKTRKEKYKNKFIPKIYDKIYETPGLLKFRTRYNKLMCAIGLGPGFKVTPIQMAVFIASMFNGGKIMKPVFYSQKPELINEYKLPANIQRVYNGMERCVTSGTGGGFVLPLAKKIYAKSGSTRQHKRPWNPNGWFTGVVKFKQSAIGFVSFIKDRHSTAAKYLLAALLRQYIRYKYYQ